ncbi:MAG: ABC transporter permease [Rectinemataceae bacterium]|jgi:putative spermidine/putrescine transport system permease protein
MAYEEIEQNQANPIQWIVYLGVIAAVIAPFLPQLIWPFAKSWFFPGLAPSIWGVSAWQYIGNPDNQVLESVRNSLVIAVLVTIISVLLGVPAGRALGMYRFRGKGLVELFILAPSIIPGLAVIMGIHVLFIRLGLADKIIGVVLVHLIPTIPYMTISMSGVFANYDPDFEEQARSLGASPIKTFFLITLPAVFPGIVTGAMFAFLISWGQYILTVLIGGGRVITLPLLLFAFATSRDDSLMSALSIIFLLPAIIILFFTSKFLSGKSSGMGGFGKI